MNDILKGRLTRLAAVDYGEQAKSQARWFRDSELRRLMDGGAARLHSVKATEDFIRKEIESLNDAQHYFSIRSLEDDRLLGDLNLDVIYNWMSRDAFVGIGVNDRNDWGRGYGSDAMKTALRFAFLELNLRRVTLTVFEYNPRAIRSYEKAGFRHEGRLRGALLKDGKRWDMLYMGILYDDWKELNHDE
ncbi:MAG: hypothetical protein KPEEDBHJ_01803 [Anaerolineales bacterium]|nr:hypothetical protein [Anaerolineales bacterium]